MTLLPEKLRKHRITTAVMLTVIACCTSIVHAQPFGFAINSDSNNAPESELDSLYRINLNTGDAEFIGNVNYNDVEGLAFNTEGQLFGADDDTNTLILINQQTGAGSAVGGENGNLQLQATQLFDFGMTFSCTDSQPIISSDNQRQLYRVDLANNAKATFVGDTGDVSLTGLATWVIDDEQTIYGIGDGVNPNLYRVDPDNGSTTFIGALGAAAPYSDAGLAFDADGQLWAITDRTNVSGSFNPSQILRIDTQSGAAEVVAETLNGVETLAITALDCENMSGSVGGDISGVPAMSRTGLLLLTLILAALSCRILYQRRN